MNMKIYNKYSAVPKEAQKPINAGRLKGMTDINPMWRIRCLTEEFGPCGIGWVAPIKERWLESGAGDEVVANVRIGLKVKVDGVWSEEIEGIGGSMLVANERAGLHTSDEAYKMAYTDAISVACKSLGFGADIYWGGGRTKYSAQEKAEDTKPLLLCADCGTMLMPIKTGDRVISAQEWAGGTEKEFGRPVCRACRKALKADA